MIDSAVSIHRGSVVEVGTDKYIVITDIDDNGVYKTCKMLKTYNTLKWKDEIGTIVELPCIVSNFTLYSDGLEIGKYMITEDGKRAVIVSSTSDTLKIKEGMRFIFNHNSVFKVTDIDDYSMVGILNIVMAQDVFINDDDKEQNIAVNVYDTTPAPEPPPVDLAISGSDEIKIGNSQDYTIINNTNYTFLWSVNSNKVTIINFNTISCTLSAVFDSNNVGTVVTLTAIAQENSSIVLTKDITIKGMF